MMGGSDSGCILKVEPMGLVEGGADGLDNIGGTRKGGVKGHSKSSGVHSQGNGVIRC